MNKYFTILLFALLSIYDLKACTCNRIIPMSEAISKSNIIIVGKILEKEIVQFQNGKAGRIIPEDSLLDFDGIIKAIYKVQIVEKYKGKLKQNIITLITGLGNGDCGYSFSIGNEYVIYASKQTNKVLPIGINIFSTNICTRTIPKNEAELQELRQILKKF